MEAGAQRRSTTLRGRNRKPLSDATNTISQSQSSQSSSATVIASKTKPKPILEPKRKPKSVNPSTSLPSTRSSILLGDENCGVLGVDNMVLNRRQTAFKRKGKEKTVVPSSSYSAGRLNVGGRRNEHEDKGQLGHRPIITVPLKKKQRSTKAEQDASLQNYFQQQRAYFEEVDAFELLEEEVASGKELD